VGKVGDKMAVFVNFQTLQTRNLAEMVEHGFGIESCVTAGLGHLGKIQEEFCKGMRTSEAKIR